MLTPLQFGQKLAADLGIQPVPKAIPEIPKAPAGKPGILQTAGNMLSNSGRVGGGMLNTLGGGLGTATTGAAAGLTNAWNAVTPQRMNTSPAWTQGVNNALNKSVELTNAGARDVYGGLGGDQNYRSNKSWDVMQRGLNTMPQNTSADKALSGAANLGAYGGHVAWNLSQFVPMGMAASRAIPAAMQYGKNLATAGVNAVKAPVQFVRNTFRPGFSELRNSLRNTARVYNSSAEDLLQPAFSAASRGPVFQRQAARNLRGIQELNNGYNVGASGQYITRAGTPDVATSLFPRGTPSANTVMRHELTHGLQAHTKQLNSLPGMIQQLRQAPGPWRQAAGHLLAEVSSNAAEARAIPQQIRNGFRFLTSPENARYYSNYYGAQPFAGQYAALHRGAVAANQAARAAAMGGAGLGGYSVGSALADDINNHPASNAPSPQ